MGQLTHILQFPWVIIMNELIYIYNAPTTDTLHKCIFLITYTWII